MFLLWRTLLWIRRLLNVDYQFRLGLVLVDRPRRVVHFLAIYVEAGLARPRAAEPGMLCERRDTTAGRATCMVSVGL